MRAALAGGTVVSLSVPWIMAPTRLPLRVSSRESTVANCSAVSRLRWRLEPKSIEALRSIRNQAVISRSSV